MTPQEKLNEAFISAIVSILYTCNTNIIARTKAAQGVRHFIHLHN